MKHGSDHANSNLSAGSTSSGSPEHSHRHAQTWRISPLTIGNYPQLVILKGVREPRPRTAHAPLIPTPPNTSRVLFRPAKTQATLFPHHTQSPEISIAKHLSNGARGQPTFQRQHGKVYVYMVASSASSIRSVRRKPYLPLSPRFGRCCLT